MAILAAQLQEGEDYADLDCGCKLDIGVVGGGPRFFWCHMHAEARHMMLALEDCQAELGMFAGHRPQIALLVDRAGRVLKSAGRMP